jgi:hypothetical protein
MPVIFQHISIGRGSYLSMELEASRYQSLIVLIRSRGPSGEPVMRLGMPMVDDNLDFLKGSLPAENGQRRGSRQTSSPLTARSAPMNDVEQRMIPGVKQLREARAYESSRRRRGTGDDYSPLVDWDLGGLEDLGLPFAAQLAGAGSSIVADPVRFTVRGNQVAALADVDRNDRHFVRITGMAKDDGEGGALSEQEVLRVRQFAFRGGQPSAMYATLLGSSASATPGRGE